MKSIFLTFDYFGPGVGQTIFDMYTQGTTKSDQAKIATAKKLGTKAHGVTDVLEAAYYEVQADYGVTCSQATIVAAAAKNYKSPIYTFRDSWAPDNTQLPGSFAGHLWGLSVFV